MAVNLAAANNLLTKAAQDNPELVSVIQDIITEIENIGLIVYEPPLVGSKIGTGAKVVPLGPLNFTYTLTNTNVILSWTPSSVDFTFYELREATLPSLDWELASRILTTSNNQVILDPITIGTHVYLLKSINSQGVYSTDAVSLTIVIPVIGDIQIIPMVINNTILFNWNVPDSTFLIDHYEFSRDGVIVNTGVRGTFFFLMEVETAIYTYGVRAVNIIGDKSALYTIVSQVNAPPDFELQQTIVSTFGGTIVNGKLFDGRLYFNLNLTETYQAHFTSRSWAGPSAQVAAGFPLWLQPTVTTGSYEEIFDFGVLIATGIVSITYLFELISGAFTFGLDSRLSTNGTTWGAAILTPTFYAVNFRYIKVKISFTSADTKALLAFYNFAIAISLRRENDGGEVVVSASDVSGTAINFNKAFYDVESITATVKSAKEPYDVIIDFNDIPNPTLFKAYVYDYAGLRVTKTVEWKARGVL